MFAIAQLLFLVCVAGFDWLWGCGVVCVWVGRRENGKGGRDKNIADKRVGTAHLKTVRRCKRVRESV